MDPTHTLEAPHRQAWRSWLESHGAIEREIWLIFHRKGSGHPSITYPEALEEALCFGWIDGVRQRIDDQRYAQRFTPRRYGSRWSERNLQLAARLEEQEKMTDAGRDQLPPVGTPVPIEQPVTLLTAAVQEALAEHPEAWAAFQRLPPSHQRRYVAWISAAKREATRNKRLQEALELLKQDLRLGLGPGEVRK